MTRKFLLSLLAIGLLVAGALSVSAARASAATADQAGAVTSFTTGGHAAVTTVNGGYDWKFGNGVPPSPNPNVLNQSGTVHSATTGGNAGVITTDGGYNWEYSGTPPSSSPQYWGLGASAVNTQPSGWDTVYPRSDAYCTARVQAVAERVPANTAANDNVPPTGTNFHWGTGTGQYVAQTREMLYNFSKVDGSVPPGFTTDEILEWASCKWGMDQNTAKSEAIAESNWIQSEQGDSQSGCAHSYGLLQVRDDDGDACPPDHDGWGGYPWTQNSTAVDADAQMAYLRTVYDAQSYMGNGPPALTGGASIAVGAPIWDAVSSWQSGVDSGPDGYTSQIQSCLSSSCWTTEAGA